jgi:tetratricopeptide (TPR) repeat protein
LSQRSPGGKGPSERELARAKIVAAELTKNDPKGSVTLAVAMGFHKAGQHDLAVPYASAAATKLNAPAAHLNYGDVLLTVAEHETDQLKARSLFERAVEQYDLVLKAQPNSIEAVNNEAWILHSYLGQTKKALEMVLALRNRVDAAKLPGEFYDTLGAVQEALGESRAAERAYLEGLKRSPEHPVLNFHFGKLIAALPGQGTKAKSHLSKALSAPDLLSPGMAQEASRLIRLIDRAKTQN